MWVTDVFSIVRLRSITQRNKLISFSYRHIWLLVIWFFHGNVENATNIEYWQPSVSKKSSCSTSLDCSAHVYCFFSPFTPLNPCRWLNVLQPPPLNHVFALLIRSTIKCTGRRDHWSCKYMSIPARIHVNAAQFSRFITMRQIHADALHWPHPLCSSSHTHTHTH